MPTISPLSEDERLEILSECQILDTKPERAYDDIVGLAARLCEVPIAVVSFVAGERQWSKAFCGVEGGSTPRELSFCSHAVDAGRPVEVANAAKDPRFANNPMVIGEPFIRYYYGFPLTMSEGHVLGTLCLIDRKPRQLKPEQHELISKLTRLVVDQLEARRKAFRLAGALERVRTLETLLPMCACCKKVREEKGYWEQVEEFFLHHGTQVTHGYCPACEARMMSDL